MIPRPSLLPSRRASLIAVLVLLLSAFMTATASLAQGPTAARANSYDDAWQAQWVSRAAFVLQGADKVDGFVLYVGDSLTHSYALVMWPRNGSGQTAEDAAVLAWARASQWSAGQVDVSQTNGWYLAAADTTGQRGMTSSSGLSLQEFVSGCCNGGPTMPVSTLAAGAQAIVADGTYTGNLQIDTVANAFQGAQFAVVMLGTNDPANPDNIESLSVIVDKLEAQRIVPILSTIPPRNDGISNDVVIEFNAAVTRLARARSLPLIDLYQEIVLRRPGTTWLGTLISSDGVHLSGSSGGYAPDSDPYVPGGDAATHTTGDAALNVGYLLRSWLIVQKLKEVKAHVVDGVNGAPTVAMTAPSSGATYSAPATVTLAAAASDDGTIARVDFLANAMPVGSDDAAPYESTWTNVAAGDHVLTAVAVDDQGATTESATVSIRVTAAPTPAFSHVGDLDGIGSNSGRQTWRAAVTVALHDAAEAALLGAVVSGEWSGGYSGSGSCTTGTAGTCVFSTNNINVKKASASFAVTAVVHTGFTYRAASNHDVDGSSNGSTVTIQRPR